VGCSASSSRHLGTVVRSGGGYEKFGLLRAHHLRDGHRVFDVDQVLDLLRIDLLRSLGVGIKDISRLLEGEHTTLRSVIILSPATD
jgi:DNA-binding transcriptional MerR regulator